MFFGFFCAREGRCTTLAAAGNFNEKSPAQPVILWPEFFMA
jgi:hypothetical protein